MSPFDDGHPPPLFSTPRPLSAPTPPPLSPVPPDFDDDSPINSGRNSPLDGEDYPPCRLAAMNQSINFIQMVREATLDSQFSTEELSAFRDPQENDSNPEDDRYLRYSIRNFIDLLGCADTGGKGALIQRIHCDFIVIS